MIATSLHPVRWIIVVAVVVPLAVVAAFLFSRLGDNQELARNCARAFRIVLAIEVATLAICALLGLRYERRAREQDAAQFRAPGKLVDIGGYRLHLYCSGGGGPTVVLEHGHRATYLDWYRVQPEISKFARVCSFDRAGYGWSESSPKKRVPSVMAEELHTLLHTAGEKPPYILVGHSFGVLNAIMFAHKFPQEVGGLVLVDGPAAGSLRRMTWRSRMWMRMMQFTAPLGLPRWRGWCRGSQPQISGISQALTCRTQFFATVFEEDADFPDTANELRRITSLASTPVVVIARDPGSGRNLAAEARHNQEQRQFAKLSTDSKLIVAEGSGHDVPLARPDVVVDAVKGLIKR